MASESAGVVVELAEGRGRVEGSLLCVDPSSGMAVVRTGKDSFKLVNPAFVSSVEGVLPTSVDALSLDGIDVQSLEKKEAIALRNAEESMASLNFEVSIDTQNLFYRLQNLFPAQWEGKSIVLLDLYRIDPPSYDAVTPLSSSRGSEEGLQRVVKVLAGERKKLKL